MKKLVSLVMVVIMLSALCATAMAAERVTTIMGTYFGEDGYVCIGRNGTISWAHWDIYNRGCIFETIGDEGKGLPIIAAFTNSQSGTEVYEVTLEGDTLSLQRVGGYSEYGSVSESTYTYTFTKQ